MQAPLPAVLVIEEYDKLDCPMRGFFRQLLESRQVANVTLNRQGAAARPRHSRQGAARGRGACMCGCV